jgi:TonB-linked SusC/RagA family outer membrane protein
MRSNYIHKNISILILVFLLPKLCLAQGEANDTINVKDTNQQMVIVGFGVQPEWMVTGAVTSIGGDELRRSFASNLGNALKGNVGGLTVSGIGNEPGSLSSAMRIRGLNTFGSGTDILVIVDGFECSIEQLDPEEIEMVVMLKDAAATAIYGSKGANGVLLVTTKRGYPGTLKVHFNMQYGYSSPLHMPRFLGSYDYARLYNEAMANDGKPEKYDPSVINGYRSGENPYLYPNVDWHEEVLRRSAPISKYNLNFMGGNETVKYYAFLGFLNEEGLYKKTKGLSDFSLNSKYQRFNYRSNVDINLTKRLSAHLTLGGIVDDKSNPAGNGTEGLFQSISLIPPNAFPVYNPDGSYGGSAIYSNPWGDIIERGTYASNGRVFQGSFMLTEQLDMFVKGLSISAQIAFNSSFTGLSNKSRNYARYAYSVNDDKEPVYVKFGENTQLAADESQPYQWRSSAYRAFINYDRSFNNDHLTGFLMFNSNEYTVASVSGVAGLPYYDRGVFGRFAYAINKKYIGQVSFGFNATDNFPKGNRWGFFPAASLGWVASNEGFLEGHNVVDYLKLRGSYGMVGNDKIGGTRFMFYDNWAWGASYYFGTSNVASGSYHERDIANRRVTWEKQKQWNAGIDAILWNNIELSLDVFKQYRNDILTQPNNTLPMFLGLPLPSLNIGKTENNGFETMLRYNSSSTRQFQYYAQANVWYAKSKIIDNAEELQVPGNEHLYRSGRSLNQSFVLEAIGFFKNQADIDNSPRQTFGEVKPGDIKYKDQNGDGVIDNEDRYPLGITDAPLFSLGSGFSFKKFDFNLLLQGTTNKTTYLSGSVVEAFQNHGKVSSIALGRWTENTHDVATYPRLSAENNMNNYQPSSFWQRDGGSINLRNIELGYVLPESITAKAGFTNARAYINGTNLFVLDKLKPEEKGSTFYPSVRTYSLGLKFQF